MIFRLLHNIGIKIPPLLWLHKKIKPRITFIQDFVTFKRLLPNAKSNFPLAWQDRQPCLKDNTSKTKFDRHYIYHTAWAARILAKQQPAYHVDISSTLFFSTMVSAFIPVTFYDYRPAQITLDRLTSSHADLISLPFSDGEVRSLSCMHVVEHIGLGRYGDQLDPNGDLKAMNELQRVLAPGGMLLFVVPVGQPKIVFNAHRIYAYQQILEYFNDLQLREFSLIPDKTDQRGLIPNATQEMADAQSYGCGCFWFEKC